MKNSTISKQWSNTTDLYSTNAAKSHRLSMLWLMLLTLLLVPTRMVAQTDYAYAEFDNATRTLTFKCGPSKPEEAYDLNMGKKSRGGLRKAKISIRWSSMLRLPMQDQRAVIGGSLTAIV